MPRMPWMKFWPADWLAESSLKLISRSARSLWIDILCVMHSMPERGVMRYANGEKMTDEEIVSCVGGLSDLPLLREIESKGVSSRTDDGALYCRKMVKQTHISAVRSEAGRFGAAKTNSLPKVLPQHLPQQKARQTVASSILPLASASSGSEGMQGEPIPGQPDAARDAATIPNNILWGIIRHYPKQSSKRAAMASLRAAIARVADERYGGAIEGAIEFLKGRVRLYAQMRGTSDMQYINNMDTWLDKGRYEDNPDVWKSESHRNGGESASDIVERAFRDKGVQNGAR